MSLFTSHAGVGGKKQLTWLDTIWERETSDFVLRTLKFQADR